jgi:glycosyltransferase involved in cell wall biosynthesis
MNTIQLKKIAVMATISNTREEGGAEKFYINLVDSLNRAGINTTLIKMISKESKFIKIKESYLRFYDTDLSEYDGVISTKAPNYIIKHNNHICYLLHTMRVFYDMFDYEFPNPSEELLIQRKFIHDLDSAALSYPRTKKVFVIGKEVQRRLWEYNKIESTVLYPSTYLNNYYCNSFKDVLMPGRLHRWKRVDLAIKAMKYVKSPVSLIITGTGEDEKHFHELAQQDRRIFFTGRVSEEHLINLYSNALVVIFIPIREDFGLITLEAFKSKKPIITCNDSGEPALIVKNERSGFICKPRPKDIAKKIDLMYKNIEQARIMGKQGFDSIKNTNWNDVAKILITSLQENAF